MQTILLWFFLINGLYMFRTFACPSSGVLMYRLFHFRMWCYAIGVEAVVLRSWCVVLCTVCQLSETCRGHLWEKNHSKIVCIKLVHLPYLTSGKFCPSQQIPSIWAGFWCSPSSLLFSYCHRVKTQLQLINIIIIIIIILSQILDYLFYCRKHKDQYFTNILNYFTSCLFYLQYRFPINIWK